MRSAWARRSRRIAVALTYPHFPPLMCAWCVPNDLPSDRRVIMKGSESSWPRGPGAQLLVRRCVVGTVSDGSVVRDTLGEAKLALVDQIARSVESGNYSHTAVRNLAEAYAWLHSPGQPHGGSAESKG